MAHSLTEVGLEVDLDRKPYFMSGKSGTMSKPEVYLPVH
jgi:hypothetical protein